MLPVYVCVYIYSTLHHDGPTESTVYYTARRPTGRRRGSLILVTRRDKRGVDMSLYSTILWTCYMWKFQVRNVLVSRSFFFRKREDMR